jgi:hypothetical protein
MCLTKGYRLISAVDLAMDGQDLMEEGKRGAGGWNSGSSNRAAMAGGLRLAGERKTGPMGHGLTNRLRRDEEEG